MSTDAAQHAVIMQSIDQRLHDHGGWRGHPLVKLPTSEAGLDAELRRRYKADVGDPMAYSAMGWVDRLGGRS
jgi:hypothetical protein